MMLTGLKITVLAESLRAHWQMGSMDDWFCRYCKRSHGCDTAVEVMGCDDDGLPIPHMSTRVLCGECFDGEWKEKAGKSLNKMPAGITAFVLDGRLIDWGCPPMSPPTAFQPLSGLLRDAGEAGQ